MLNWIAWNRTVLTFELRTYVKLNCLKLNSALNDPKTVDVPLDKTTNQPTNMKCVSFYAE